ncbi:MAG: Na/Pi cotransporter family protein [Treponema sp.]|nr:Na/Pi cotransporter family protein [Treponema sp.]
MTVLTLTLEMIGALGLFLYGMKVLSDGIQSAAGDRLKSALNQMTRSPLAAVLTGLGVTTLVQSSSATTVMVVSFVNAGLLTLIQAVGVIMGANIGTTVTAWIVSLIGFKFKITLLAMPMVGVGFILSTYIKSRNKALRNYGDALIGFGILFIGLDFLSHTLPKPSPEVLHFLSRFSGLGFASVLVSVLVGTILTILVHSSSASTAIVITLALEGVIDFRMAAGLVLGCNIGTTIDAFLASLAARVHARRAAWAHILFNVAGTVWAVTLFDPFLRLVGALSPGGMEANAATRIAMLHTVFNVVNTLVLFPFVRRFAGLLERLVRERPGEAAAPERLRYVAGPIMDSPEMNLLYAQKEISDMAALARDMFVRFRKALKSPPEDLEPEIEAIAALEDRADQMREELTGFILECASHEMGERARRDLAASLRIVDDLENITDDSLSLMHLLDRGRKKKLPTDALKLEELGPYTLLVENFLGFVVANMNKHISDEQLAQASEYEDRIDGIRATLKKSARKRLKAGANVKLELLYIDLVRHVEKIGDHAFGISRALREMR